MIGGIFYLLATWICALQLLVLLLMFHLICYNISHRIGILSLIILKCLSQRENRIRQEEQIVLQSVGRLFDQICKAWNEFNSAFSSSLLVISVTSIIFCATSLFFSIYSTSSSVRSIFFEAGSYTFIILMSSSIAIILIFLKSADMPISQVSFFLKALTH